MAERSSDAWRELMSEGRYAEAWRVSDAVLRERRGIDCSGWPRHEQFIWDGTPLRGKRVLVRCYHGLGDTIQYVRLLPQLRRIAREVTLWVQPKLLPLLRHAAGIDRLLPLHDGAPDVPYDVDVELAELLHALRVTLDTLPATVPYLDVGASFSAASRARMAVGLVWRAGEWDERRSIPHKLLEPLRGVQAVDWSVFQLDGPPRFANVLDEARALRELDLLVSVDSFPAHLAGALAVPVWLLLHADPDWRWMRGCDDSPWYPRTRLFRQPRAGDWQSVIASVCAELQRECGACKNGETCRDGRSSFSATHSGRARSHAKSEHRHEV